MITIHMFDLEELIAELGSCGEVRLETFYNKIDGSMPGVGFVQLEIHVRAVKEGDILTWCAKLGQYTTAHGTALSAAERERVQARQPLAEAAIKARLDEALIGTRPGLIDIGGAQPVSGWWAGLDPIVAETRTDREVLDRMAEP